MAFYLLTNPGAKNSKAKALVVQAESAADAKTVASSYFDGDSGWSGATSVALTGTTLDAASCLSGWTFKIIIRGGAAQSVDPIVISHTASGTDDLDAVAADLVTALNADADIANAAYSAPDLTISSIADGLGDAAVTFHAYPPASELAATDVDLGALFVGAGGITDEGIAAAVLEIALVADTESKPKVFGVVY